MHNERTAQPHIERATMNANETGPRNSVDELLADARKAQAAFYRAGKDQRSPADFRKDDMTKRTPNNEKTCPACKRKLTIRGDATWVCPSAKCINAGIVQAKSK